MLPAMPKARELLADKGYDADWFRAALAKRGVAACIPSKSNRKVAIPHDALLYKQRHKIENMFGRLKDWRRIHTRYDRCAHTYFSAICLAAAVLFWLSSMSPEPSSADRKSYSRHCHFTQQIVALSRTVDCLTLARSPPWAAVTARLIRRRLLSAIAPACSRPRPRAGTRRRPESWRRPSDSPTDISIPPPSSPASDSGHRAPARRRESFHRQ